MSSSKDFLAEYWRKIPKDLEGNQLFRLRLIKELGTDLQARREFLKACISYPPIAFDSLFWTFNPRKSAGKRNLPFILRPKQHEAVLAIKEALDNGHDLLINKSRDEGATWLITSMFFLYWLLVADSIFLVASRKEDLVDKAGSRDCLFYRFIYLNRSLPSWIRVPNPDKTHLHWGNPLNGSVINGESTNENLGAGGRALGVMLDEFGRVDARTAQSIRESVADVSDCVIYNSTHFYGRGHPFAKLLYSRKCPVIWLPWYDNPAKNGGLYRSSELNEVEILDEDYYKERFPDVFGALEGERETEAQRVAFGQGFVYKHEELSAKIKEFYPKEHVSFIADGESKLRAPWYDQEESRRDKRDMAQNIDMDPIGAGDMFFDSDVLSKLRQRYIRNPKYAGEIEFNVDVKEYRLTDIYFRNDAGRRRFKWWGSLDRGRPTQGHNYIVACDISLGTGGSNSVAGIYDVNTCEKVGLFVTPNLPPESFAEYVFAICNWTGGACGKPYLIWEGNGPGGSFDKRLRLFGYNFVYFFRQERKKPAKRTNKRGWYSNRESKYDLLLELRVALANGVSDNSVGKRLIIYDEPTISEYEDYLFFENGDIGLSECMDETSGAKTAHGDRVIPDGLFVLACSYFRKASVKEAAKVYEGTMAHRRLQYEQDIKADRGDSPWLF